MKDPIIKTLPIALLLFALLINLLWIAGLGWIAVQLLDYLI
ncbi:MAG: hypothetical protein K0R61_531 [Microvirga sp.]|jgi:hypothetical protein|nr:hypothetical protein [Microvirga sp.]